MMCLQVPNEKEKDRCSPGSSDPAAAHPSISSWDHVCCLPAFSVIDGQHGKGGETDKQITRNTCRGTCSNTVFPVARSLQIRKAVYAKRAFMENACGWTVHRHSYFWLNREKYIMTRINTIAWECILVFKPMGGFSHICRVKVLLLADTFINICVKTVSQRCVKQSAYILSRYIILWWFLRCLSAFKALFMLHFRHFSNHLITNSDSQMDRVRKVAEWIYERKILTRLYLHLYYFSSTEYSPLRDSVGWSVKGNRASSLML